MSILEGYVIGLGMVIFIGPVFFLLLNSSLQSGVRAGVAVALGIIVSDIICVALCYYGLSSVITIEKNQFWIGVVGSIIILILGISYLLKKAEITSEMTASSMNLRAFFLKGFSVNFFNPFVFVVWISAFNYGKHKYPERYSLLLFMTFILLGILTTDLLKVFLSKKVKRFISLKRLTIFFRVTGVILILFSIRLLYLVW